MVGDHGSITNVFEKAKELLKYRIIMSEPIVPKNVMKNERTVLQHDIVQ